MKKLFFLIFVLFYIQGYTQNLGEIYVDKNNSATLNFDRDIDFVVFGNNAPIGENQYQYYDFFTDGGVCVIRGNSPNAPKTSITVKLKDQSVWYGFVQYGKKTKILYSYSVDSLIVTVNKKVEETVKETSSIDKIDDETLGEFRVSDDNNINDNIIKAKQLKREIFTVGQRIGDVELSVNSIRNDKTVTYFVLEINNKSGNTYSIDGILFKYIEGKRKGFKKNEASTEERLMPLSILGKKNVMAYSSEIIGVAIPIFSINNTGKAEISIREKDGTRSAKLTLKGKMLNKIKIL